VSIRAWDAIDKFVMHIFQVARSNLKIRSEIGLPGNGFRIYDDVDEETAIVYITVIGVKRGNRL
jgi:hypothetical protein